MKRAIILALSLGAIAGWIALLSSAFAAFGFPSYLEWCLRNGATIAVGTAAFSFLVKDLRMEAELLSWHPAAFVQACAYLVAGLSAAVSANTAGAPRRLTSAGEPDMVAQLQEHWDYVMASVLGMLLVGVALLWVVVFAPFHYLLSVITGAPARRALGGTGWEAFMTTDRFGVDFEVLHTQASAPAGAVHVSLAGRPLALTSAINAGVLLAIRAVVF